MNPGQRPMLFLLSCCSVTRGLYRLLTELEIGAIGDVFLQYRCFTQKRLALFAEYCAVFEGGLVIPVRRYILVFDSSGVRMDFPWRGFSRSVLCGNEVFRLCGFA
jgi:hypothetical protein